MPKPEPGESEKDFVSRCIPIVLKDGTAKDNKQAAAVCYSMYREGKKNMDSIKIGAMISKLNMRKMQTIHDNTVEMGAVCGTEEDKSVKHIDAAKMLEMGPVEYAIHEGWDVQQCCSVVSQIIGMCQGECNEGEMDEAMALCRIAMQLLEHCKGECQEIMDSMTQASGPAMLSTTVTQTPIGSTVTYTTPAQVKTTNRLDLSYVKSLGMKNIPDFLAVKFVAKDEIKGYSHMWGNPNLTDIEVEYFNRQTDFWDEKIGGKSRPLTWDHAQDKDFKAEPVIGQIVDFGDDDIGRWYVAKLNRSHLYNKAIAELIKQGKLGTSSDSAPQYVERVKTGKATWLKTWPFFAAALTDTPCEPRMIGSLEFLKSLGITLPEVTEKEESWESELASLDFIKFKYK